jgi:hypothetical protein
MSSRRRLGVSAALAASLALTACANLPTSGNIQLKSLRGGGGSGQIGVQVAPRLPGRAWRPDDIVKGFLAASASNDPGHAVARKYLTDGKKGYGPRWRPGWGATIIDSPHVQWNQPPRGVQTEGPASATVVVTGRHVEQLQTAGRYQAGSVVVAPADTVYRFSLVQESGQWRIDNIFVNTDAKPNLLLMSQADFERFYQPRNLYFYPAGPPSNTLVPDPVFIPQQVSNQGITGLVRTLINPPPAASWLYKAATTAFPPGTKLLGAQVTGGITAVVDLGGTAAKASPSQRERMKAQLALSLTSSPSPAQAANPIQSVVLKLNGRPFQLLPTTYAKWVPSGSPKLSSTGTNGRPAVPLYYQVPGGATESAPAAIRVSPAESGSFGLPKMLGGQTFRALAISRTPAGEAVLAGCLGKYVYLIPQARASDAVRKKLPAPCTSLSWDDHGNLWIAAQAQVIEIPDANIGPPARPGLNAAFGPSLTNPIFQTLQVAPDGVRVAMIIRTGSSLRIQVAAISKSNAFTYLAQTNQMLRVGSDVVDPVALTWLNPDHLLVLDRLGPTKTELFEVPLNGGQSTEIPTPRGVASVAASQPAGQSQPPLIVIGIAPTGTTPGKIEESSNGLLNPDWKPVASGITPVFAG